MPAKGPPIGLAARVLGWNGILHATHLLLAFWSGRPSQVAGILGGFCVTSALLWGLIRLGRTAHLASGLPAYALYVLAALYNLFSSFHWYFFGLPFTYSRLIDGAQFLAQEPAGSTGAWGAFLVADALLTLVLVAGPLVPRPRRGASRNGGLPVWRLGAVLALATAVLFLLVPGARGSNLVSFLISAPWPGTQPVPGATLHVPLRSTLPESAFEPVPRLELPAERPQPSVLIFELESAGAPYISLFDPREGAIRLPNLERIAASGLVARRHYALNGGSSHNNDWALMTSLYPPNFGQTPFYRDPWIQQLNLFSYFKQADYLTGTFYAGNPDHRNHYKLFKQPAADIYVSQYSTEGDRLPDGLTDEERAMVLMFGTLDRNPGRRFALIYRTYSGHFPYRTRQARPGMSDLERYHLALLEMDRLLGRMVDGLEERKLLEDTVVVVVGDHGEAFRQHENLTAHAGGVYEELVRTPFLISYPRVFRETVVIDQPTTHLDVLPTLLELAGLDLTDVQEMEGYSLLRTLPPDRAIFVANGDDGLISGTLQDRYKLIQKPASAEDLLFDLAADPLERDNLIDRQAVVVERLRALEERWVAHRRSGIGQSRFGVREDAYGSSVTLAGNVDVDLFLDGRKLASLSDSKKAVLPLDLRKGLHHLSLAGVVRHQDENTGLHVRIEHGETWIGTGPWWGLSTSPAFVSGRDWLRTERRDEDWRVPAIDVRELKAYLAHRRESWIRLDRGTPFVVRLDFEVGSRGLASDTLRIQACQTFELRVDGVSFGRGERADQVHELAFVGRPGHRPEILLRATGDASCFGLLVEGQVGDRQVQSRAERWDCAVWPRGLWHPAARLDERRVVGPWSEGAEWFWSAKQSGGRVVCRYKWD